MAAIFRCGVLIFGCSALLVAQNAGKTATSGQASQQALPAPQAQSAPLPNQPSDDLAQLRTDLNRMESLNMNMSSEIEFLHDQNLQILLRTNSQMWTVLIRDMRRQLERDEQRRAISPVKK